MDMLQEQGSSIAAALNARIYGHGNKTLVLAHGFGADQTVWFYILPYLVCYFKVLVFDMAFTGSVRRDLYDSKRYSTFDSYARDLTCLLDELNVTNSIYLGHSMSAMVGCIAAVERPELFEQLILLSGSPRYLNAKGYVGGFERSDIDSIFQDIKKNYSAWVSMFAPKAVGLNDPTSIGTFKCSLERMNPKTALDVAKTVFLSDLRRVLRKVKVPCTIIQSKKDLVVPLSVPFYMEREIRGDSRVEILETEGHLPQLTAHTLLLDVLKRVLDGVGF